MGDPAARHADEARDEARVMKPTMIRLLCATVLQRPSSALQLLRRSRPTLARQHSREMGDTLD
jgi:hypothetical protein